MSRRFWAPIHACAPVFAFFFYFLYDRPLYTIIVLRYYGIFLRTAIIFIQESRDVYRRIRIRILFYNRCVNAGELRQRTILYLSIKSQASRTQ